MPVDSGTRDGGGWPRRTNAKKPSAGRREITEQHKKIPDCFTLRTVPQDGACLFHSIGIIVAKIKGQAKPINHRQVRAEILAHLKKHRKEYEEWWDGCDSHNQEIENFDAYLKHMKGHTIWGGALEIALATRHWDFKLNVVPCNAADDLSVYHDVDNGRVGTIWYTGVHYDVLECDKETVAKFKRKG